MGTGRGGGMGMGMGMGIGMGMGMGDARRMNNAPRRARSGKGDPTVLERLFSLKTFREPRARQVMWHTRSNLPTAGRQRLSPATSKRHCTRNGRARHTSMDCPRSKSRAGSKAVSGTRPRPRTPRRASRAAARGVAAREEAKARVCWRRRRRMRSSSWWAGPPPPLPATCTRRRRRSGATRGIATG